jgi:YVTN family beta-propeller protein
VANAQDQTVSVVDVDHKRVAQTLASTQAANRLRFTPDGKYVFVSDLQGIDLLVLDVAARKEYKKIRMPGNSEGIIMAPDGGYAYTTLNSRDAVAVIDLKTMAVAGEVKTGKGPDGLGWAVRK